MNPPEPLPYAVSQAVVVACRDAFHWRGDIRSLFLRAGVPRDLFDKYDEPANSKAKIARWILDDLASRPGGSVIQRNIVEELCRLRRPHADADQVAGSRALAALKEAATESAVLVDPDKAAAMNRSIAAKQRVEAVAGRRARLGDLRDRFLGLHKRVPTTDAERQQRGYDLERLLADLFRLHDVDYKPSYRTAREQIDGAFHFRGFTYITETRWRSVPPTFGDLADFKAKVDGKMESTRGMFVSMAGFDLEVLRHLTRVARNTRNNIIFVEGKEIARLFEGGIELIDFLTLKVDAAEQKGSFGD